MTGSSEIQTRLETGRPLLLGSDPMASIRARGRALDGDAPLGRLVREAPDLVAEHYHREIAAGADVIFALTSETMPRALATIGMAFRAAALTGTAVDLALEAAGAAPRPVAVAGVLGARWIAPSQPDRVAEEYALHAARLAADECHVLVARGYISSAARRDARATIPPPVSGLGRLTRSAAIVSGVATQLPTWALLEVEPSLAILDGESLDVAAHGAIEAGACAVLLDVPSVETGRAALARLAALGVPLGVLLADEAPDTADDEPWTSAARALLDAGARAVGGGRRVTARRIAALARALGRNERSSLWPRAV